MVVGVVRNLGGRPNGPAWTRIEADAAKGSSTAQAVLEETKRLSGVVRTCYRVNRIAVNAQPRWLGRSEAEQDARASR